MVLIFWGRGNARPDPRCVTDVPVAADDALRTAQRLALKALLEHPRDAMHADLLRKRLAEVD